MCPTEITATLLVFYLVATSGCHGKETVNLDGAGATFPSEVYKSWMGSYSVLRQQFVDVVMTYDAVGSGSGKSRIQQVRVSITINDY